MNFFNDSRLVHEKMEEIFKILDDIQTANDVETCTSDIRKIENRINSFTENVLNASPEIVEIAQKAFNNAPFIQNNSEFEIDNLPNQKLSTFKDKCKNQLKTVYDAKLKDLEIRDKKAAEDAAKEINDNIFAPIKNAKNAKDLDKLFPREDENAIQKDS